MYNNIYIHLPFFLYLSLFRVFIHHISLYISLFLGLLFDEISINVMYNFESNFHHNEYDDHPFQTHMMTIAQV